MYERIKEMWLDDLRNPAIQQGKRRLRINEKYCCIGRLCELHRLNTGEGEWVPVPVDKGNGGGCEPLSGVFKYVVQVVEEHQASSEYPPLAVLEWAGLGDMSYDLPIPGGVHPHNRLTNVNDMGYSFMRIAYIIDEHF